MKKNQKNNNFSEISYKKIAILTGALFIVFFIVFLLFPGTENKSKTVKSDSYLTAKIIKITDGDTIWIEYDEIKKKVRLIGINCPEVDYYSTDVSNMGKLSTEFTESLLVAGQTVYLQKDTSDTDDYGRLLRYIWLEKPKDSNDKEEIRTKMLNALILLNGYANAKEYAPDSKYTKIFSIFESEAKENQLGIWKPLE